MTKRLPFLALFSALLLAAPAQAATLFFEDFQDGEADGWGAMGDGDIRITEFAGNRSLRLQNKAAALTAVPIEGYENIRVSISFAADSLEPGEACQGEVSVDGTDWFRVVRVEDGQDDALTLHTGSIAVPDATGQKELFIGIRAIGSRDDDTCWADNIRVTGRKIRDDAAMNTRLSLEDLTGAGGFTTPVGFAAFAPGPDATAPTQRFEGRLVLGEALSGGGTDVLRDDFNMLGTVGALTMPGIDVAFVQSPDGVLVPTTRGLVDTGSAWDLILSPGRVWTEPGDNGFTRAAIPFALQERNANCTHNGVLTFAFKDDGAITSVAYQVGSETCLYFKSDLWGSNAATYIPGPVEHAEAVIAAYGDEVARRLPVRPLSALAEDHPGADPAQFGSPDDIDPDTMTAFGVVVDGVHYVAGCETRFGAYPYCDVMALPSYSLAKTLAGGLALMRLEVLYPGAKDALIADYVPACRRRWDDVTFEDALDMATGRYEDDGFEADEAGPRMRDFFLTTTHAQKIDMACNMFPRRSAPGRKWVYHTSDTYLLGAAINAFLRRHQPGADFYRTLLVEPIWTQLGLSPAASTTRRTEDDVAQPFAGWGLTFHRDDIARLATFMANDNGMIADQPVIDPAMLDAALQRVPGDRGLEAGGPAYRYRNGVWAWNAADYLGCAGDAWIPFMSGYGGLVVAMMPNGITYYYVSDGATFAWGRAAKAANAIRPFCQP